MQICMQRRELLKIAAAAAALTLLPGEARAAWSKAAMSARAPDARQPATLTAIQRATLAALADAIIPRTDTPSAIDVGVLAWIDVIVADYYTDADRRALSTGLDAIEAQAQAISGQSLSVLTGDTFTLVMNALDTPYDRNAPAARGYSRVKGLVVHGYFTSERVQRDVLKTDIMPGRFDGAANMPARNGGRDE
ncbi:gluconate 2-dehydrogenase subunit 3 family protein [Gemmatimonas sp.]|uniref:gluconate 2-dehydrogenase subunit 3 family protein n=2 Tax=Gemmatimonas sp. TaxID=1962908 RepID=UPI00356216EF